MALGTYSTTDHDAALATIERLGYKACLDGIAALLLETHTNLVAAGAAVGSTEPWRSASQRVTACAKEVYGIMNGAGIDIA